MQNILQNKNEQKALEALLASGVDGKRLLLHSCCAPCSSYVIEYLSEYLPITVFYFNPNISEEAEYRHRAAEEQRLISEMPTRFPVDFLEGEYKPGDFLSAVRGFELEPEGGARCRVCFSLRLSRTAAEAAARGFDYFTTTLTISPLKDAALINELGRETAKRYQVEWLPCDFKKKDGYKRSIELSAQYGLYRQNYCGCVFSKR